MVNIPVLDGEEWWASKAIDDTDSVIRSMLELTISCVKLNINLEEAVQLHTELSLHTAISNIELKTNLWLAFCDSLRATEVSKMAYKVENKLNAYVSKYQKK
jgi:hypothetical protein